MAFYHVVFSMCVTIQGYPQHCEAERMVDTMFHGLVSCYSAAKEVETMTVASFKKEAVSQNFTLDDVQVKTRCMDSSEGDKFLKKNGPSALVVTGKKFD